MEVREEIKEELKKYIGTFEKYDNEITESLKQKEIKQQEDRKKFDEKWGEDIFPTDKPIKDKEEAELLKKENQLEKEKQKLEEEKKNAETKLRASVSEWSNKIDTRMKELVEFDNNREKYIEQKSKLEKQLSEQKKGIETWEKNGVKEDDALYRRRKNEIIPNLEKQIKEVDFKLNKTKIREEYKQLAQIQKQVQQVKLHDRKHILPELAGIFEIAKEEPKKAEPAAKAEPVKAEPVKTEPVKAEPVKTEPAKTEPVKAEPVKTEPEKTEPVKTEPAKTEPIKTEPAKTEPVKTESAKTESVKTEPTKTEPVKTEPAKTEPAKTEPVKEEPAEAEQTKETKKEKSETKPLAQIIIGRKIKVRFADGKTFPACKTKEYFKYVKESKDVKKRINSQLLGRLHIDIDDKNYSLENIDPVITFSMLQAFKKELVAEEDIKSAIQAINERDKEKLNKVLPISVDKKDLSKRAYLHLPWNINKMRKISMVADRNADLIESIGEYEPNPLKRIFNQTKKLLSTEPKREMITDGSEKQKEEEIKTPKTKLNEREDIKLSEAYVRLEEKIKDIHSKGNEQVWYEAIKAQMEKGNLSAQEAKALDQIYKQRQKQINNGNEPKETAKNKEQESVK